MSDTRTYDELSALCAQMAAALEGGASALKVALNSMRPDDPERHKCVALGDEMFFALTAYATMSPDPQWQRVPDMVRELTALKEAVTPSAGTKAAYMGEFSFNHVVRDENGDEDYEPITVPWTTIKEIMAAIANRARGEG